MLELNDWRNFPTHAQGGILCVGNFDGVHLGHAAMLQTGRQQATQRNTPFTIMTFDPHPAVILRPNLERRPLTTLSQRREILASFNPDFLIIIPTSREFLSIQPEDFLKNIVRGTPPPDSGLGATLMVEGPSFTFGRAARGNIELLKKVGPTLGLDSLILPTQQQALSDLTLINVSSTLIRWLIEQGRVADAAKTLGRPYTLRGTIAKGAQRGRTIGFPTANLQTPQLLPAPGVYAGYATLDGRQHRAAISVGANLTFNEKNTTVEAYFLDYPNTSTSPPSANGELYGHTMDLAFVAWIREMYNFAGVHPLVAQMKLDVDSTRKWVTLPATQETR